MNYNSKVKIILDNELACNSTKKPQTSISLHVTTPKTIIYHFDRSNRFSDLIDDAPKI